MLHFLCLYPNLLEAQDIKIIEKDSQLIHSKCFWAYIKKKKQKTQKSKKKRQEINLGDMQTENKTQHNTKSITPLIRNEIFILVLS